MAQFLVKVAGRTGPSAAAGWSMGIPKRRSTDRFNPAGVPGVLGQAPDPAEQGRRAVWAARQSATVYVLDFQSAVSDVITAGLADPDGAGSFDQAAAGQTLLTVARKRTRARKGGEFAVGCVCRPAGVSEDVHNHCWRAKKRQHGRSARPLHLVSAHGADFP